MERFNKFAELLSKNLEGFEVKFKDSSTLMKIISYILFFNKSFMTSYVTTIGNKVYWPSKERLEMLGNNAIVTLAHEYQHAKDAQKRTAFLFGLLFLIPQIFALPGVLLVLTSPIWITLMALSVISWSWWLLPFLLTLIFLAPIPAPWRMHYEVRGNIMSLFAVNEIYKEKGYTKVTRNELLKAQIDSKNKRFVGADYYFMWPFGVKDQLDEAIDDIISEEIFTKDNIYSEIAKVFKDSK